MNLVCILCCWLFYMYNTMMQLSLLGIMKNVPNVHTAYLQNFFLWTWVLKHNKCNEIRQFSEVDIKQNDISKVILLIFSSICAICKEVAFVYITKPVFYLISNHIFVYIIFCSDNKWCAQRLIEFTDENLKPKIQNEDEFIYIMNKSVRPHFHSVFNLQINNSEICLI